MVNVCGPQRVVARVFDGQNLTVRNDLCLPDGHFGLLDHLAQSGDGALIAGVQNGKVFFWNVAGAVIGQSQT